jgi:hypothetical protein
VYYVYMLCLGRQGLFVVMAGYLSELVGPR